MKVDKNVIAAINAGIDYERKHNVMITHEGKEMFVTAYLTGVRDALKWVNKVMETGEE